VDVTREKLAATKRSDSGLDQPGVPPPAASR
jgi:hypothetical protein